MSRAFLIVMDSVGCGGALDVADFGDAGANTLGHILKRFPDLKLPHLDALGLRRAVLHADPSIDLPDIAPQSGGWAIAHEVSNGKDTPSGHWELAGVPVPWDWHYFEHKTPAWPPQVFDFLAQHCGGSLGNCHASGVQILDDLGGDHLQTGLPICYTSADSVFQIAAHETGFGLQRLYDLCAAIAPMMHNMQVGRVIARPFVGDAQTGFTRTKNRRDYAITPPSPTLCDWANDAGRKVRAIGKIGDIFSMRGIDELNTGTDVELMEYLAQAVGDMPNGSLTFANFVEFDSKYGHTRDVAGYAQALEWFDAALGSVLQSARAGDIFVITADHGNDPTWRGSDHTRESVPVLVQGRNIGRIGDIGFVDVAASVATHLGLNQTGGGRSFL